MAKEDKTKEKKVEEEVVEEEEETILQPIAEGAAPASTVNAASNAYD